MLNDNIPTLITLIDKLLLILLIITEIIVIIIMGLDMDILQIYTGCIYTA